MGVDVERLTGQDAGFLYNETPSAHMHTMKIAILDPAGVPGGYSYDRVKEVLQERLHLLPPFRRRLQRIPLDSYHPVWLEDPDFDLEYHLFRTALPAPGGREEFDALISQVASHQLDRSRPLWELWVVEGMEGGRVGFVAKMHHSIADGVMAAALLSAVMDLTPDAPPPPPPSPPWQPDEIPSKLTLWWWGVRQFFLAFFGLPSLIKRTMAGGKAVKARKKEASIEPPAPFAGPKVSFNRSITPHRIFVSAALSLSDVKKIKTAFGVTINDVILALGAGALRSYLEERGELPDKALVASVPVSVRDPKAKPRANSVSSLFTSIPVHIADPVERLMVAHEITAEAKKRFALRDPEMLAEWSELQPPHAYSWFMRFYSRRNLANLHRPPINLIVSNVPGPTEPLYCAGARLEAILSVGPLLENTGLNVTVWSYLDQLNVGILGVRELSPDLRRLTIHIEDTLDELLKLATEQADV